ncbi:hypothetical protein CHH72_18020 [Shouchella clausii]|uniref:Uncharacterized protein n=1 Tax=Shouchella clausii TaxID=79880 RepID=A0A268NVS5_SHOCL|nr:hypothetical protein CHH72_18020 [Shouchella clausii]
MAMTFILVKPAKVGGVIYGLSKARKVKTGGKGTVKPNYVPKDSSGKKLGLPKNIDGKLVKCTTHKPDSMNLHNQIGIKKGQRRIYSNT